VSKEIERKYLIEENGREYAKKSFFRLFSSIDSLRDIVLARGEVIKQGYMSTREGRDLARQLGLKVDFTIKEARLREKAGSFYFTLKSAGNLSRKEKELEIDSDIFNKYWQYTKGKRLEKVRLKLINESRVLEIDVYTDRDLIIVEVEVPTIDEARKLRPVGLDVTAIQKYKNKNLGK
jgi:CYTH domain-containing protein